MTTELEHSFINVDFDLKVASNLMNRAVRVKQTVKDKVSRVFYTKIASVKPAKSVVQNEVAESKETGTEGIKYFIDLSNENISKISDKVDALVSQGKVEAKANRAVLFTNNLLSKIKNVASKWFGKTNEQTINASENVKIDNSTPSVNENIKVDNSNSTGSVIPATWTTEVVANKTEATPIPSFAPNVEISTEKETKNVNAGDENKVEIPVIPSIASFVPTKENVENKEEAVVVAEQKEDVETPQETSEEPVAPTIIPTVEEEKVETKEEPKTIGEAHKEEVVNNNEYVQEPTDLSNGTKEIEKTVEEIKTPVEDKITELLNRTIANKEQREEKEEEKPNVNQAYILAKLQRIGSDAKVKDAKIKSLGDKVSSLEDDNRDLKTKLGDSESQVKEVSAKNIKLEDQVEKLTSSNANMESAHAEEIKNLNVKIDEMSKARREEHEEAKRKEEKMQSEHSREIDELKQAHAEEIRKLTETYEKKIEAIYRTIADALGESVQEGKTI